jgi:hypothetical protein
VQKRLKRGLVLDKLWGLPYTRFLIKKSLSDARKRLLHKRKRPAVITDVSLFPCRHIMRDETPTCMRDETRREREGDGLDEG